MDVTNPGLINVADQSYGNPSTAVQSLAIPEDSDVLTPVADEGYPRANDVAATGNSSGPTPTATNPINQPPASPPLSLAQLPGMPPAFTPFPQTNIVNTVDNQQASQNQIQPAEFQVIGTDETFQTNQTDATRRQYTVTAVQDADTGGPVVDPTPPIVGSFVGVDQDGSNIIILSATPFDPHIVDDVIVTLASLNPAYNFPQTVFNLQQIGPGVFNYATKGNPSGTVITLSSLTPFPVALVSGTPITISGSSVAAYNGPNIAQNVTSLNGAFDEIDSAGPGQITVVSHSNPLPAGLVAGKLVWLDGAYFSANPQPVSKVINDSDTIASIVSAGGGTSIRVTSTHALPADIANGQLITISGTVNYNGTYAASNVTGGTFDLAVAWVADESVGSWTAYTFNLPISFTSSYNNTWSCNTFDISFASPTYTTTATGGWQSYTFELQGAYSGTATGTFTYTPPSTPTTRYKVFVSPQDLQSFGVSMLGREIAFSKTTITFTDRGATRIIGFYGNDYVVINKSEDTDLLVPVLDDPVPGDILFLNVQRQGGEVTTEPTGNNQDVTIFPPPAINVPNPPQGQLGGGTVAVSTGPQPGAPTITGGVQVPTAINVNVASQATSVGLPTNVYV
jgi:hypothetical protein